MLSVALVPLFIPDLVIAGSINGTPKHFNMTQIWFLTISQQIWSLSCFSCFSCLSRANETIRFLRYVAVEKASVQKALLKPAVNCGYSFKRP